jgi:hypothetical protein
MQNIPLRRAFLGLELCWIFRGSSFVSLQFIYLFLLDRIAKQLGIPINIRILREDYKTSFALRNWSYKSQQGKSFTIVPASVPPNFSSLLGLLRRDITVLRFFWI